VRTKSSLALNESFDALAANLVPVVQKVPSACSSARWSICEMIRLRGGPSAKLPACKVILAEGLLILGQVFPEANDRIT